MKIAVLKITGKIPESVFASLLEKIDREKQERIRHFLRQQDKQRCLFAELLARVMLLETRSLSNADISFASEPYGKPVWLDEPRVHFNTSHAGDWIACIVDEQEVGIDVEQIGPVDLSLSGNFFSGVEHVDIISHHQPVERFFDYWTLKESYIKFIGSGLSRALNSFSIQFVDDGQIRVEVNGKLLPGVYCKQYELENGYKLAICAAQNDFPVNYRQYTYDEVVQSILNAG